MQLNEKNNLRNEIGFMKYILYYYKNVKIL